MLRKFDGGRSDQVWDIVTGDETLAYQYDPDPSVLNCPQTDTEDDHPVLRTEVEAAVQSLMKGKSAGVDNIPAELVQAGGEDEITALTTICNRNWHHGRQENGQLHGPRP